MRGYDTGKTDIPFYMAVERDVLLHFVYEKRKSRKKEQ